MKIAWGCLLVLIAGVGCTATRSAKQMASIQRHEGFYTDCLWYRGSTKDHHYFNQDRHAPLGLLEGSVTKLFRVPLKQLNVPKELIFPFNPDIVNQLQMKIGSAPPYSAQLHRTPKAEALKKVRQFRIPPPAKK